MIKLKDFVDVNLTSVKPSSSEENKTVVYIYGLAGASRITKELNASNYSKEYTVFDTNAKAFIGQFFALGGASLRVIQVNTSQATSQDVVATNNNSFISEVKNLPMDQVAVVLREASPIAGEAPYDATGYHFENITASSGDIDGFETILASIKESVEDKGTAFRKLLIRGTYNILTVPYITNSITDLVRDSNLVWKLCNQEKDLAGVLAYLSKVTMSDPKTFNDYSFTEENSCEDMSGALTSVNWSDIKDFVNVDVDLEQNESVINLGGNTSAGFDLIQEFESIYISQKIVAKEMTLLKNKLNLLNARTSIHSAIIDVMEAYFKIGYLVQTTYSGSNIYRNVNGKNICVLSKGEVITAGYKVIILPKKEEADARSFPEIEIILNTNKGIRYIKTTGLVL